MPQGIYSYADTLKVKKNPTDLNPLAPPDPTKVNTTQGATYNNKVTQNLNNPAAALTGIGQKSQQEIANNLNNPDQNRSAFGDTYDKNLTQEAASGKLYGMDDLAAQTQRANAQNLSRTQGQTQESLAAQGIKAGTAGYARALGMANAGVQSQNLDRTQALNANQVAASKDINARLAGREGLAGNRYSSALGMGREFEANAKNAEQNAMSQALGIEQAAKQGIQTKYNQDNTNRLEGKTEQVALINSVQDPKVKALLQGVASQGGDVKSAYQQLTGTTPDAMGNLQANAGTLNSNFASLDPSQTEVAGLVSELKAYNPKLPGESDATYNARIDTLKNKMGNQMITQKYAPLDQGTKDAESGKIRETLNTLPEDKMLEPNEFETAKKNGVIKQFSEATIPKDAASVTKFLLDNPSGIVNLGGKQYKVIQGQSPRTGRTKYTGSPRHTDVVTIKDEQGNLKYVYNNKVQDNPPKTIGAYQFTPFGV